MNGNQNWDDPRIRALFDVLGGTLSSGVLPSNAANAVSQMPAVSNVSAGIDEIDRIRQQIESERSAMAENAYTPEPVDKGKGWQRILMQLGSAISNYGATSNPYTDPGTEDFLAKFMKMRQEQADRANAAERIRFEDARAQSLLTIQDLISQRGTAERRADATRERELDLIDADRARADAARDAAVKRRQQIDDINMELSFKSGLSRDDYGSDKEFTIAAGNRIRQLEENQRNNDKDNFAREQTRIIMSDADAILDGGINPVTGQAAPETSAVAQIRAAAGNREEQASILAGALERIERMKRDPDITSKGAAYIDDRIAELKRLARIAMVETGSPDVVVDEAATTQHTVTTPGGQKFGVGTEGLFRPEGGRGGTGGILGDLSEFGVPPLGQRRRSR